MCSLIKIWITGFQKHFCLYDIMTVVITLIYKMEANRLVNVCVCVFSHFNLSDSLCHMYCSPRLLCPYDSPGKDTGVRCHALLQGIFPTQGSNSCLLASPALRILYSLSHLGCALVTRLSKMIFKYFSWVSQKMSFFFSHVK